MASLGSHESLLDTTTPASLANRLNASGGRPDQRTLFVLDCRTASEFVKTHVIESIHVQLPTILYKRLLKGTLSACSAVPDQARREKLQQSACATVVLVQEETKDENENVAQVSSLLLKRFSQDGFNALLLKGGLSGFARQYPHLCTACNRVERPLLPLLSLDRLALDDTCSASSSSEDSCQSTPDSEHLLSSSAPATPSMLNEFSKMNGINCSFPIQILPYLYLGNAQNAANRTVLDKYGIGYVLNVTSNLPNSFEDDPDFKYLQIAIDDHWSQNLAVHFPKAIAFIEEAREQRKGVLVHCVAGISRSVTVTVAYLMQKLTKSLDEAYELVKEQKPNISPNFNFMGQLLDFERQLRGDSGSPDSGQFSSDEEKDRGSNEQLHFLSPGTALHLSKPPAGRKQRAVAI